MPTQQLPEHPSLENLRKQAKTLLKRVRAGEPDALALVQEFHPHPDEALSDFALNDAQLVIARSYGATSWTTLKQRVNAIDYAWRPPRIDPQDDARPLVDRFVDLACLNYSDDLIQRQAQAREMFAADPSLAKANIYAATVVGDAAEVRRRLEVEPALATRRGGPWKWEPLLYACYSRFDNTFEGHSTLECARILLDHGADPNAGALWDGDYLFTALTGAFGEGERGPVNQPPHQYDMELARLLLERGADPNDSQTLYNKMFRADNRHLELLFEFGLGKPGNAVWSNRIGTKMEAPGKMMSDQLVWAVKHNFRERVELLVRHAVDLDSTDNRFHLPAHKLALLAGHRELADYLADHGATQKALDPVSAFVAACSSADAPGAKKLLAEHPTLIAQLGQHRIELLFHAACENNLASMHLLAALGSNLSELRRTTAMHEAAMAGHLEMVKLLLELGADPLIRDTEYNAFPRGWAEYGYKYGGSNNEGCRQVAEYLAQFEPAAPE
jgi:ankyrin repeat protein